MSNALEKLIEALPESAIVTGDEIAERAVSYWDSSPTKALALLKPRSTEEVSKILSICHAHKQTVVTQGGRSGVVAAAVSGEDDIILSLEKMNEIEEIDVVGGTATVQAGAILQTVQESIAEQGVLFPLDLGARGSCTIGGNVATNAGGINVLRYGMMRNLVLGLEAVTADGTILSSMNYMLKNNAGYDIKQLFIGSEGTLGVVTRVVLKLFPRPVSCNAAMVALNDFNSVVELLQILQDKLAGTLSAYEVMWGGYFRAVTADGGHRAPMDRNHAFYVMLEAEGSDPQADKERMQLLLETALKDNLIANAIIPSSDSERLELWKIREDFELILPAYIYDVSLPIKDMEEYTQEVIRRTGQCWPQGHCDVLGHIADGNLHFFMRPGIDGDLHAESDKLVYEPLDAYGGSVSAEHGIGIDKKDWLSHSRNDAEIALMKSIKQNLDPGNLLNPGRVFDI